MIMIIKASKTLTNSRIQIEEKIEMSAAGMVTGSRGGGTTSAVKPGLPFSTRIAAGVGGGAASAPVATVGVPRRGRWGSLRSTRRTPTFASPFRARAAVEDGVAAGEAGKSFYELLGISPGGTAAEIKRAYKEMARRYHPDVCPSPDRTEEYTRRFIEVQEAYETLSDPGRRARYDRDLARGLHLAFAARRRPHGGYHDEEFEEKSQWRNRWQDQVGELKRRSTNRDAGTNLSWGARMRRQREESATE